MRNGTSWVTNFDCHCKSMDRLGRGCNGSSSFFWGGIYKRDLYCSLTLILSKYAIQYGWRYALVRYKEGTLGVVTQYQPDKSLEITTISIEDFTSFHWGDHTNSTFTYCTIYILVKVSKQENNHFLLSAKFKQFKQPSRQWFDVKLSPFKYKSVE